MVCDVIGKKTLKCATRKGLFYGSLCNVPKRWALGREKKELKDFPTPHSPAHLSFGFARKGRARGRDLIIQEEKKGRRTKRIGNECAPFKLPPCLVKADFTALGSSSFVSLDHLRAEPKAMSTT